MALERWRFEYRFLRKGASVHWELAEQDPEGSRVWAADWWPGPGRYPDPPGHGGGDGVAWVFVFAEVDVGEGNGRLDAIDAAEFEARVGVLDSFGDLYPGRVLDADEEGPTGSASAGSCWSAER